MKKTLFSLAFFAASGVYVAAANHLIRLPEDDAPRLAAATAIPTPRSPAATAASATPLVAVPAPSSVERAPIVAETAPAAAPQPSVKPAPAPIVAEVAPVAPIARATPAAPPLPRPRPTPPPTTLQSAASTDTAAAGNGGYRDGTYTGSSENAYYGRVQVQVTIASHRIASINVLDYPKDRRTSRYINSQALPLLQQEVIAASSANVDTISGATLTSEAYLRSLGKALLQAGGTSA